MSRSAVSMMATLAAPIAERQIRRRARVAPPSLLFAPGLEEVVRRNSALERRCLELAGDVRITVAPKTRSGSPIQDTAGVLSDQNLDGYRPNETDRDKAIQQLQGWGFKLLRVGRFGLSVAGPAELLRDILKTDIGIVAKPRNPQRAGTAQYIEQFTAPTPAELFVRPLTGNPSVASTVSDAIDHFVFIPPPMFFAPISEVPPKPSYHHLTVNHIRALLNAPSALDGRDVTIAMIDSGFHPHPYYVKNGLSLKPVDTATAPNAAVDAVGHGTGMTLNVFALAPKAQVLGFRQSNPPQDAIEDAADRKVAIISCSWGWDHEQVYPIVEATIRDVIREGVIMVFAAGNGQYAWPGSMPEVISVGGVFADVHDNLSASNYASGFNSTRYPGRRVPDFCGLCGERPLGIYIPMPCPPGCELDRKFSGAAFPAGDETAADDGWLAASGTSSAAPQVAGVIALMLQKAAQKGVKLTVGNIRSTLEKTARSVIAGKNAFDFPATAVPSVAVGFGLVDATAAVGAI